MSKQLKPRKDSSPDAIVAGLNPPLREAVDLARSIIREAVPAATESVKWNSPSFATSEHFATFFLRAKTGFQVVLHLGAKSRPDAKVRSELRDPAGLLEWKSADRAVVSFGDGKDVASKREPFQQILRQWVEFVEGHP